jgi:hypothetical protein
VVVVVWAQGVLLLAVQAPLRGQLIPLSVHVLGPQLFVVPVAFLRALDLLIVL